MHAQPHPGGALRLYGSRAAARSRCVLAFRQQQSWHQRHQRRIPCRASLQDDLDAVLVKVRGRQTAMQEAASAEDYTAAAAERDALNMLQLQQRKLELELDREARVVHYEIGMVVQHRRYAYRGVIVGYDDHCDAPEAWIRGRRQPFYHVLVDENDRPRRGQSFSSTYVAQENIEVLPPEAASQVQNELIEHNFEGFVNGRYKPKDHLARQFDKGGEGDDGDAAPEIKPDA